MKRSLLATITLAAVPAYAQLQQPEEPFRGGVTYWFKPTVGIRTEFRIYGVSEEAIPMFRLGVSLR
jgi:hypothetical protein